MNNVHPLFREIIHAHIPKAELTAEDIANIEKHLADEHAPISTWLRGQMIETVRRYRAAS